MGSVRKQEGQAGKIDEMTSDLRVNIDYVIKLLKIISSVPSEILKIC